MRLSSSSFVEDARSAGFALAGVTTATPPPQVEALRRWFKAGLHGSMKWMEKHAAQRGDPAAVLEGARSVICVADRYPPPHEEDHSGPAIGRIAGYARGRDYHRVMKRRLHSLCDRWGAQWPEATFRACVDTAPLLERAHAEAAGLGRVGKNTMLIEPGTGSWLLLGEILTTLKIEPTPQKHEEPCGTCTRCIEACPTEALRPWELDANRCIAALTIEQRTPIDPAWHSRMDDWIFGCDECQTVCPHNGDTNRTRQAPFHESQSPRVDHLVLEDVLRWDAKQRQQALAGTSMTRANLSMWKRNACIAVANLPANQCDASLMQAIDMLVEDPAQPPMVREAAMAAKLAHQGEV